MIVRVDESGHDEPIGRRFAARTDARDETVSSMDRDVATQLEGRSNKDVAGVEGSWRHVN